MDAFIKQTLVKTMREAHLHEQSQINYLYKTIVKNFKIRSKNEKETLYRKFTISNIDSI